VGKGGRLEELFLLRPKYDPCMVLQFCRNVLCGGHIFLGFAIFGPQQKLNNNTAWKECPEVWRDKFPCPTHVELFKHGQTAENFDPFRYWMILCRVDEPCERKG
jgi:hypothetical protein